MMTLQEEVRIWVMLAMVPEAAKKEREFYKGRKLLASCSGCSTCRTTYLEENAEWQASGERGIIDHIHQEVWTARLGVIVAETSVKRSRKWRSDGRRFLRIVVARNGAVR